MIEKPAASPNDDFDWEEALRFKGWPKFPEQNADGIDLSLIRSRLRLTPTQRARRGDQFMKDVEQLRAISRRTA